METASQSTKVAEDLLWATHSILGGGGTDRRQRDLKSLPFSSKHETGKIAGGTCAVLVPSRKRSQKWIGFMGVVGGSGNV